MKRITTFILALASCFIAQAQSDSNTELHRLDSLAAIQTNIDSTIKYASLELDLAMQTEQLAARAKAQLALAQCYSLKNNLEKAGELAKYALDVFNVLNDSARQASCYKLLGLVSALRGASGNADGLYNRSLELYKAMGDKASEAGIYRYMGLLCLNYKVYDRAYEYFSRSLDIDQQADFEPGIMRDMYCLGYGQLIQCIDERGSLTQLNRAKADLLKSIVNDNSGTHMLNVSCALADAYLQQAKMTTGRAARAALDSCLIYISHARRISKATGITRYTSRIDLRKARHTLATGDFVTSNQMLHKLMSEMEDDYENNISVIDELNAAFVEYYETTGNYKQACDYLKKINEANLRKNSDGYLVNSTQTKIQTEYDEEMRQREQSELEKELTFAAENARFRMMLAIVLSVLAALIVSFIVIYRNNRRRKKNNLLLNEQNLKLEKQQAEIIKQNELLSQKNEEIEKQRNEIEGQRNYLSSQNKLVSNTNRQITDSILYAKKIQEAAVPSQDMMNGFFGECLVFWRPLNIVSGDFYWAVQVGNYKFLAVADCTGHGVPGAFMSMLGITLLNDIVMHENVAKLTAARVLDNLRQKLKEALRQTGRVGEAADGIDLAFCIFNTKSTQMQYAGAFRPLIIVRNNEIIEYKADKMPCGVYINETPHFTNNIIDLQSGDALYMYSDGISDQFSGGPDMRKFTIRRLKEMLVEVSAKPFSQQKLLIAKTIDDWRKPPSKIGKMSAQVDDILLIGLKIK